MASGTTPKTNLAIGGGAFGGALGVALAYIICYAIWGTEVPPGMESAIGVILSAIGAALTAWLSIHYGFASQPQPPVA